MGAGVISAAYAAWRVAIQRGLIGRNFGDGFIDATDAKDAVDQVCRFPVKVIEFFDD